MGLFLCLFLLLNTGLLAGLFVVLVRNGMLFGCEKAVASVQAGEVGTEKDTSTAEQGQEQGQDGMRAFVEKLASGQMQSKKEAASVSFQTAERMYAAGDYESACGQYYLLAENFNGRTVREECVKDFLNLRMGLCLRRLGQLQLSDRMLADALQSRSVVVRALASYHFAFFESEQKNFFDARRHAYQTLALLGVIESRMPPQMESDCYFLAAESMYRQVMRLYNLPDSPPGRSWSDEIKTAVLPTSDPVKLESFLLSGFEKFISAELGPLVKTDLNRDVGSQWTVISLDAPMEELLWKFASAGQMSFSWQGQEPLVRSKPMTVHLQFVAKQYAAEVIAGSAGLVWMFDGEKATLFDPHAYTNFEEYKKSLAAEGIAVLQRFLLRYRTDQRIANAHYALGQLYRLSEQSSAALGEFKLVVSRFPHNPLAPYALMESGKIKTSLRDYSGARSDLNELLMQYADCKIADEATLHLAQATQESGLHEEAAVLFKKVYQMNPGQDGRCQAAYGLADSAYERSDWAGAKEWFERAIKITASKKDPRLGLAYFKLGQTCIELGEFVAASAALRAALGGELTDREYVQILVELSNAEMKQENFLKALQVLESVSEDRLGQEEACMVLTAKAKLLREIDAVEAAVSLLRRRIEFIADSQLRAALTLELAHCYVVQGDLRVAERELNDVLADLGPTGKAEQGALLLAQIAFRLDKPQKAEQICLKLLEHKEISKSIRQEASELLGGIYAGQKEYDKAALAYAGVLDKDGSLEQ